MLKKTIRRFAHHVLHVIKKMLNPFGVRAVPNAVVRAVPNFSFQASNDTCEHCAAFCKIINKDLWKVPLISLKNQIEATQSQNFL